MKKEYENDVPKYKKKSTRHSPAKSKHKHNYKPCLIRCNNAGDGKSLKGIYLSEYCMVCGKVRRTMVLETEWGKGPSHKLLTNEEKLEKHKDLEVFDVHSIWDKYVTLAVN